MYDIYMSLPPRMRVLTFSAFTEVQQNCLDRLRPKHVYGRQFWIDVNTPGTLEWLPGDPDFKAWNDSTSSQLLLITGYAGYGKSVLAHYAYKSLTESLPSDVIVCRYFVDGTNHRNDCLSILLRSLIYQIVQTRRKLIRVVQRTIEKTYGQSTSEVVGLWDLFRSIVSNQQVRHLVIVLDAVDECDEAEQEWIVPRLAALQSDATVPVLKVLITSRPNSRAVEMLESGAWLRHLQLERKQDIIRRDVDLYIQNHVDRLIKHSHWSSDNRHSLEDALRDRAGTSFLWVSLTIALLHKRRRLNRWDIAQIIATLPNEISRLYDEFLQSIPEDDRKLAARMLCLIQTCRRPLNVAELDAMINTLLKNTQPRNIDKFYDFKEGRDVESLLRGLVRSTDDGIVLFHQTVKEYILAPSKSEILSEYWQQDLGEGHCLIARACMLYLTDGDFQSDLFADGSPVSTSSPALSASSGDTPEEDVFSLRALFKTDRETSKDSARNIASNHKLFDYAALYWTDHFAQCQGQGEDELGILASQLFEEDNPKNWYQYLVADTHDPEEFPTEPSALVLACLFGHPKMAAQMVNQLQMEVPSEALYWAARRGHNKCVEVLLARSASAASWSSWAGLSPLSIAAYRGHSYCVQSMIISGAFDVNERSNRYGQPPLTLAAAFGHDDVVCTLLGSAGILPNIPERGGRSPLIWAVLSGSIETVKVLLQDTRVDPNHQDSDQRSALSLASESGLADIVQLFLHDRRVKANERDSEGRTPLMYAAMKGNLRAFKHLLKRTPEALSEKDFSGRSAISWAAQNARQDVLDYLRKRDLLGASKTDENG